MRSKSFTYGVVRVCPAHEQFISTFVQWLHDFDVVVALVLNIEIDKTGFLWFSSALARKLSTQVGDKEKRRLKSNADCRNKSELICRFDNNIYFM